MRGKKEGKEENEDNIMLLCFVFGGNFDELDFVLVRR